MTTYEDLENTDTYRTVTNDDIVKPYACASRIAHSNMFAGHVRRVDADGVTHDCQCRHRHARRSDALRCAERIVDAN